MSAIVIENLSKVYGTIHALDGLDLSVDRGAIFGFLGPNGAGKTTTLRILAGVATPTSGKAWIGEVPVGLGGEARALVGYLPEEPAFYPWMRAREFLVDLVGGLYGMSSDQANLRGEEMLDLVGIREAADRKIGGFSRGMRQRLGLAQALMNEPSVLLLDEPVSALDPVGRRDILRLIKTLADQATVFMSTHILNDVERVCDSVGIIDRGRLIAVDTTDALLRRYASPIVEVAFDEEPARIQRWIDTLQEADFVRGVEIAEAHVRITLDGSESSLHELQKRVFGSNMTILVYKQTQPQLEDVFLRLVGEG